MCHLVFQLHSDVDKGDGSVKYILSGDGAGSIFTLDDSTGTKHKHWGRTTTFYIWNGILCNVIVKNSTFINNNIWIPLPGDIHAIQRLDREVKSQYVLRAQATHRGTGLALEPESQFIVKIQDINDNEPRFPDGPYSATIPEMSPVGEGPKISPFHSEINPGPVRRVEWMSQWVSSLSW